ncbi:arginine--tRNA ligase [Candidatus Saccharibacteria bacterium]|nr:arginine--tRNA ligase [Candidatus Saccharibacteria bacterium]
MDEVKILIQKAIKDVFGFEKEVVVVPAPETAGADFATNVAMTLAKEVKMAPREVAEKIVESVEREFSGEEIENTIKREESREGNEKTGGTGEFDELLGMKIQIAGPGFLNFALPERYFKEKIERFSGEEEEFRRIVSGDKYKDKVIVTEFSDPNPFKVLHIGHFYTSVVGDSISKLFEQFGAKVIRTNFGGDVGLHVGKTIYALSQKEDAIKLAGDVQEIGKCYVEGTKAYEEDEEAKNKIVQINAKVYEFAKLGRDNLEKLNNEDRKLAEIYWTGREASYKYFMDFYKRIGIKFDKYYPESSVSERGMVEVRSHIPEVYEESDGAVVFRGEKYGLHTRVFINKVGLPTYETKDVGLLFTKYDDYHFDKSIVITGNDITEYMKVVLKSVEQYAPQLVERTEHITHGNVKLPGAVKMASRKGNFVKAIEVLDMVNDELGGKDERIALAAIKYLFLKYRIGGDFDFDVKSSVSMTGNSGVYLLYSAVRARKILANCIKKLNKKHKDEWKMNDFELKLNKKIIQYPKILEQAVLERAPYVVCNYLFELCQDFSRFYENCKVFSDAFEAERAEIVRGFSRVMENGLGILGIEIPEEM